MILRLEEITTDNQEVLQLELFDFQKDFIEDIPTCLEEIKRNSYGIIWNAVGIFDEKCMVGFAMYGRSEDGRMWLDRFMIAAQHQLKGYGKRALLMLIDRICLTMNCDEIFLSVHSNNAVATKLYQDNGFCFIDELDGKDPVMRWQRLPQQVC